ncbi:MAG: ATP synthase F1 subunit gamma [Clostridium sp.]|jgi:F-type H+-transporting ATPase subunit gamma|nr:ATP synthase F1 subunit gamma [Clostridium sp.]
MASMRDIKRRKGSIQSTQQITKAMKLVSTVKLQHAKAAADRSKAYFQCMYETIRNIISRMSHVDHKYLTQVSGGKKAVLVITSNRGLAGGYNSNVVKLITGHEAWKKEDLVLYCVGSRGREALHRNGYEIREAASDVIENPAYADAMQLCAQLLEAYETGEVSEVYLAYTVFKNTVSHDPVLLKLLPVEHDGQQAAQHHALMNFEPKEEEALEQIIPKYVTSLIYGAFMEALASENAARMQAMDSATSNAEEMIEDLSLAYNRARQGSITQELTEIIAGAEAIS